MVLTIKKGMTKEEIDELLKQLPLSPMLPDIDKKPIDVDKYSGKLKWEGDVIEIQRRMRDDSNYNY
jgi:DNA-directed RNA polymerase subunit H (RpoH/RPB5)